MQGQLEQAIAQANDDPAAGISALIDAVESVQSDPIALRGDPELLRLREQALLTLARAQLASEQGKAARASMDEAIRSSRGELVVDGFGPGLAALHRERQQALVDGESGRLNVDCQVPCRVFVNEVELEQTSATLFHGSYRVHIEAGEDGPAPVDEVLDVTGDVALEWPEAAAMPEPEPLSPQDAPASRGRRILPRWSEAVLIAAGAVAVGVGAALLAIDGKCPGGVDPMDVENCPEVYMSKTPGIASLAAGGAVLVVGGVLLTVDEVRVGRARGRTVQLGLRMRF